LVIARTGLAAPHPAVKPTDLAIPLGSPGRSIRDSTMNADGQ
jgi:hypothetical protein